MSAEAFVDLAKRHLGARRYIDGPLPIGPADAVLFQSREPTPLDATIYQPLICLVLQGAKVVSSGSISVTCGAGQMIVVSHRLPVVSKVTIASHDAPYMAMIVPLDVSILRGLLEQSDGTEFVQTPPEALAICTAQDELTDALFRLLRLAREPQACDLVAPLVIREVHARLLLSPHGGMLARFLWRDDQASRIGRAIEEIHQKVAQQISIPDLARTAGMSKSSFHVHFKKVTGMSPVRYHKELRLLEARSRLRDSTRSISAIAFDIGYESPSQFSREYSRKFGAAPSQERAG